MDKDFVAKGIAEGVNRVAFLYGESVINQKNNCCENNNKMTEEEILYQMACDFNYGNWCKVGSINVGFWSDIEGKNIAKYFAEKLAARDVEMQKQIAAVRGLIEAHKDLLHYTSVSNVYTKPFEDNIRTLTETLKPYLGDDKLEV
jgi:hypothetical protein